MTARKFQEAMVNDLDALFSRDSFKTSDGGMAHPKAYKQFVPYRQSEDDPDPFPFIIVRLDGGGIESQTDPHKINVILVIGIYDDDPENNGHLFVLEIIERILKHYEEKPLLAGQFVFRDPFEWALQDEEEFPYFYGACKFSFDTMAPRIGRSEFV